MLLFKKLKKRMDEINSHECIFQKVQAEFTDILGETFKSKVFKWANTNALLCSVPEYLMISVNENGYIKDEKDVIHIISNIVKMNWKVIEEKRLICRNPEMEYRIFYTDEELEKYTIREKEKAVM